MLLQKSDHFPRLALAQAIRDTREISHQEKVAAPSHILSWLLFFDPDLRGIIPHNSWVPNSRVEDARY